MTTSDATSGERTYGNVPCRGDCPGKTRHEIAGANPVGRPVWRCTSCGTERAGPLLVNVDVVEAVADGGGLD